LDIVFESATGVWSKEGREPLISSVYIPDWDTIEPPTFRFVDNLHETLSHCSPGRGQGFLMLVWV